MSALVLVILVLELTLFELFAKETFLVSLSFSSSIYILFQNSYQSRISNWTFFVLFLVLLLNSYSKATVQIKFFFYILRLSCSPHFNLINFSFILK